MDTIRIFACDPDSVVTTGLREILTSSGDLELVGVAADLAAATEVLGALSPDIVLVALDEDITPYPGWIEQIRCCSPGSRTVLWARDLDETEQHRALQAGARGVLVKTLPIRTQLNCLRAVGRGGLWFQNSLLGLLANTDGGACKIPTLPH